MLNESNEDISRIRRLTIRGFKSLRLAEIELRSLNVLVGENGAGKSNLIALFSLLHELVAGRFQQYVESAGRSQALLHYGPKVTSEIEAIAEMETKGGEYVYKLTLTDSALDTLAITEEKVEFRGSEDWPAKTVSHRGGRRESQLSAWALREHNTTAANVWKLLKDVEVFQFHDTSRSSPMRRHCYVGDDLSLGGDGRNISAVLHRLMHKHPESYSAIVETVKQIAPYFANFELRPYGPGDTELILNWKDRFSDQVFGPHLLSDGTLRAICLITLLLLPLEQLPFLIVIDEPELGLHPAALVVLAALLRKASHHCQVIVATQSATLLDEFQAVDILVVDRLNEESVVRRLGENELDDWLEDYTLGHVWRKNVFGGGPFS